MKAVVELYMNKHILFNWPIFDSYSVRPVPTNKLLGNILAVVLQ